MENDDNLITIRIPRSAALLLMLFLARIQMKQFKSPDQAKAVYDFYRGLKEQIG